MAVKMLVFDYRESERRYIEEHWNELNNFEISFYEWSLNSETLERLSDEDRDNTCVISVFIESIIDREVISGFKNLRVISTRSTGVDHIDKKACEERNIMVVNVESYGSTTVAQYTFGLLIALARNIIPADLSIRSKNFCARSFIGRNLGYLTLGVIGTGAIGANLCNYASAFGMKILAYDLKPKLELMEKRNIQYVEFDDLLQNSDVISLHIPYTGDNYHLLGEREFSLMQSGAMIINTSRGELIDIKALYENLNSGKLKGAALDVLECEDISFKCDELSENLKAEAGLTCRQEVEILHKLADFHNVIITPHIAYETQEAIDYILKASINGIKDCLSGSSQYRVV